MASSSLAVLSSQALVVGKHRSLHKGKTWSLRRFSPVRANRAVAAATTSAEVATPAAVPTRGESVRTALELCVPYGGSLSVTTESGPLATRTDYILDQCGCQPIIRLGEADPVTTELVSSGRCCLLIVAEGMGCQVAIQGTTEVLEGEEELAATASFPSAALGPCTTLRLNADSILYSGPYADPSWVESSDVMDAEVDIIAPFAADIVRDMNGSMGEEVQRFATVLAGAPTGSHGVMTWVDRLGFDMAISLPEGPNGESAGSMAVRVPFSREVADETDARSALMLMAQTAWERERPATQPAA